MNTQILSQAANQARGLAMDAVHKANSGHLGLPLGCAEIGAVLWGGGGLNYDPNQPRWLGRDRFVLSAGHGSMFLYSWLHIAGYKISREDVSNFRQLVPSRPDTRNFTKPKASKRQPGLWVRASGTRSEWRFLATRAGEIRHRADTKSSITTSSRCAATDVCKEGVGLESVTFAGHVGLDNLILIFDANGVTLDAMAEVTQSDDVAKKFESLNWDVFLHRRPQLRGNLQSSRRRQSQRQSASEAHHRAHRSGARHRGSSGHGQGARRRRREIHRRGRVTWDFPPTKIFMFAEVKDHFAEQREKIGENSREWAAKFEAWRSANPELAKELDAGVNHELPADLMNSIPEFRSKAKARRATLEARFSTLWRKRFRKSSRKRLIYTGRRKTTSRTAAISDARTCWDATCGSASASTRWARFATVSRMTESSARAAPRFWCSLIIAARRFVWRRCRICPSFTSSPTIRSALAKTAQLTSPSKPFRRYV
jgi:transketolase